jgi:dolichol-phosphate mannosyltransferase
VAFIFPIYNEAGTIDLLHQTVTEVTGALAGKYEFSFIYVDDGSRDQSLGTLTALTEKDNRVTVIELSRNFGHQMAVTAGLDLVDTDATIIMDSDMQDPPRVALELIGKWEQGFDVVYAQRRSRQGSSGLPPAASTGRYGKWPPSTSPRTRATSGSSTARWSTNCANTASATASCVAW